MDSDRSPDREDNLHDDRDEAGSHEPRYAVLADEPVSVTSPRRKARTLAVLFATAIVACSGGGAYVATVIADGRTHHAEAAANARTDQRLAALEQDLARRRAAQADENARTTALLVQYRRTVCTLAEGRTGPEFDQLRADYGCADLSSPTPAVAPPPSLSPRPPGAGQLVPHDGRPPVPESGTRPAPRPDPRPSPTPTPGRLCLPLVGCL